MKVLTIVVLVTVAVSSGAVYYDSTPAAKAKYAARSEQIRIAYEADRNAKLKATPGMEDCVFYDLNGINVIRCPHSSTTTEWSVGKGGTRSNTTDSQ